MAEDFAEKSSGNYVTVCFFSVIYRRIEKSLVLNCFKILFGSLWKYNVVVNLKAYNEAMSGMASSDVTVRQMYVASDISVRISQQGTFL